jgi:hypothetical protein
MESDWELEIEKGQRQDERSTHSALLNPLVRPEALNSDCLWTYESMSRFFFGEQQTD